MKILKVSGIIFLLFASVVAGWCFKNMKDRHPGYNADLRIAATSAGPLSAGFGAVTITPEVPDTWVDVDGDGKFNEKEGDYYIDGNGNGMFDPVWIAGFSNNKPASAFMMIFGQELWYWMTETPGLQLSYLMPLDLCTMMLLTYGK